MASILAVVSPITPHASTCGYCGPPGQRSEEETSVHAAELIPMDCTCLVRPLRIIPRYWLSFLLVGLPDDDRPGLEEVGNILLQARLEAVLLSTIYHQVCSYNARVINRV